MIRAENISFKKGDKTLLNQVSTTILPGQITAILGPNGAGKSTLLKCLTGINTVTTGMVSMNNQPLADYSVKALSRLRAVLSQSVQVNFPFTAYEIVQMGCNPYEQDDHRNHLNVGHLAMEVVDATHLKNRIFPTLSGGEQQRVQLARVLTQLWGMKETYLFLDEPTSALDLKHQHQLMTHMQKIAQADQTGVCIVMHDLQLAMRYADQLLLMKDGKLFAAGAVEAILTKKNIEYVFEVSADVVLSRDFAT